MRKKKAQQQDNINSYRIAHYLSIVDSPMTHDSEYVVILQPGERSSEYCEKDYEVNAIFEIEGDASTLPCSRTLKG